MPGGRCEAGDSFVQAMEAGRRQAHACGYEARLVSARPLSLTSSCPSMLLILLGNPWAKRTRGSPLWHAVYGAAQSLGLWRSALGLSFAGWFGLKLMHYGRV